MKIKILIFSVFLTMVGNKMSAQCGAATNLTHGFNNAIHTFSWNSVPLAVNYQLEIMESGAYAPLEVLTVTTDTSFVTPGGLLSASYDWRIITICQNGDMDTTAFSTFNMPCPSPTGLTETNITQTSATLNWVNPFYNDPMYGNVVILAYRPIGGSWIYITNSAPGSDWVLNNLNPNTTYEWCANLNCAYFNSSPAFSIFTTLAQTCLPITSQSAINVSNTTSQLTWSYMGGAGAIGYALQYKLISNNVWTTINTTNNFYTLTGLTANSTYQFRVATMCAGGSMSAYSSPSSFQTNCVDLNNTIEHIRFVQIKDKIRVSGADPNGYSMWNDAPTLTVGSSYTFKIAGGGQINNSNKQNVALFLDVNQNNIFEQNERVTGVGMLHNTNAKSYTFTVPANTLVGTTRARAVMLKQNQGNMVACPAAGLRGEIEDYEVTIVPLLSARPIETSNADQSLPTTLETRSLTQNIQIFPNPVQEFLYVEGRNILDIQVYNVLGQLVLSKKHTGADELLEFGVADLQSGMIVVQTLDTNGAKTVTKIIKN